MVLIWPATQRFADTLAVSHEVISRVEILVDGQPEYTIDGSPETVNAGYDPTVDTPVVGGRVTVDRSVARRRLDALTFIDTEGLLTPTAADDLLVPLRTEVRVYRGVRYSDWTAAEARDGTDRELVPIGTFVITDMDIDYPQVTVSGYDRMWAVQQAKFTRAYQVGPGTNLGLALQVLITSKLPTPRLSLNLPATDVTSGNLIFDEQTDPGEAATTLATAAGWALYADPMGVITAVDEPYLDADNIAATYQAGPTSMLVSAKRSLSAANTFNAVVTTGESSGTAAPVRGYAEDTNPQSLTYVPAVGVFPRFHSSPVYVSTWGANLGAQTILRREGGIADTTALNVIPDPRLEAGDVLYVADDRGLDRLVMADSFGVGLRASDAQDITARSQVIR